MKRPEHAYQLLDTMLRQRQYRAQSRLPPERELARELSISRMSLRAALLRLEAEGRIWRRVGQGTFVGSRPMPAEPGLPFITAATSPAEVLEIRLALEPQIARLAAMRAKGFEIAEMTVLVQKGRSANDPATWEEWDWQFHRALCAATRNQLFMSLFDSVNAIRAQPEWQMLRRKVLTPEKRSHYAEQHQSVLEAITSRQALEAERAMRAHVLDVTRSLFGPFEAGQASLTGVSADQI